MEKDEKKASSAPYYDKRPKFGNKGPSKLRQQFSQGMTYFLVIVACVLFYFALLRLDAISGAVTKIINVLKPVIYGLAIAYLLNPIVKNVDRFLVPLLEKKLDRKKARKLSRGIGVITAILFLIVLIVALCNMLIPELYKSIRDLIYTLPGQLSEMVDKFNHFQSKDTTTRVFIQNILEQGTESLQTWLRNDLRRQTNTLMSNLTVGVISIVNELLNFLIGLIVSVYVLFSKELFAAQCKKIVYALMKTNHANMMLHLAQKSNDIFGGFIIGKIIDSAIIGVLCFIGLTLLNMPYTLLVSVIVGVTNIIPFFGPYIGAIPSALLILLEDPRKGIYFIIFILFLQQLDGNIIGPKILGDSTGLSAFWVVFSILLGGGLFGVVGMIVGVPTFAVIYYIIMMIVNQMLERKKLPLTTVNYGVKSYVDEDGQFVSDDVEAVSEIKNEDEKSIHQFIKEEEERQGSEKDEDK